MKSSLTVFFQNTPAIEQVLEAFEKFVRLSNLQAIRKKNKQVQKWVCEVEIHSQAQKDLIVSQLTEIESLYNTKIEYKVSLIQESEQEKQGKWQKITSQEVKKENEQYQIHGIKNNQTKSNGQGTPVQSCQTISVSSDEFQALDYEIQDAVIQQKNIDFPKGQFKNEHKKTDTNQNNESEKGNTKKDESLENKKMPGEIPEKNIQEENIQVKQQRQKQSPSGYMESKTEQKVNFEQNRYDQTQIQETNDLLFKYYTGKDDYTTVFKISSNDQIGYEQAKEPQKNQPIEIPKKNLLMQEEQYGIQNRIDTKIEECAKIDENQNIMKNQLSPKIPVSDKNIKTHEDQIAKEKQNLVQVRVDEQVQTEQKSSDTGLTQVGIKFQFYGEKSESNIEQKIDDRQLPQQKKCNQSEVGGMINSEAREEINRQGQIGVNTEFQKQTSEYSEEKLAYKDSQTITNDQSQHGITQAQSIIYSRISFCNSTNTMNQLNTAYEEMIGCLPKAKILPKYGSKKIIVGAVVVFGLVLAFKCLMD